MKERIRRWYRFGLWTAEMVQDAVIKNVITEADALEILKSK
jgi:hypothetical protein